MSEITENTCHDCAMSSFNCTLNSLVCDVDNHVINDECKEGCKDYFIEDEA